MQIQFIRNATLKISYAGQTILGDPMFSPKGAFDSFAGIARNPTADLPLAPAEIMASIDAILVTHLHPDHFDPAAVAALDKETAVFCKPDDEDTITGHGFQNLTPIDTTHTWQNITLTRTGGQHGRGPILQRMGTVAGFILQAEGEPTLYWIGDSIWCDDVEKAIETHQPDIIITHSGGAIIPGFDPILMDVAETITVAQVAPKATVIAIHMESLDHCPVQRAELRQAATKAGIPPTRLLIPADGETITL